MLSLLTLNIQAAALARARGRCCAGWTAAHDDVFVLTETSNGPGTAHLLDQCRQAGLTVIHTPDATGERGVALVSRVPDRGQAATSCRRDVAGRVVAAGLIAGSPDVTVIGVYVPSQRPGPGKVSRKRTSRRRCSRR